MQENATVLERAFALAKSGKCRSVEDIRRCLNAEGYWSGAVTGRELSKQLRALIEIARLAGLEFLEGGEDADGGGFGEGGAVERDAREGVGGFAGDCCRRGRIGGQTRHRRSDR